MPTITPLPSPPSTSDPANFSSKADAHILALQTFTTEVNAFGASLAGAGIITPTRDLIVANATTTDLWNHSIVQDWTGTATVTNFPAAPAAGSQRISYPAAGTIITHGGNISVQGNATYTVVAGDELTITAITTTTFYVTIQRKDGKAIVGAPAATDTTSGVVELLTNAEYAAGTDTTRALTAAVARSNNLVLSTAQATTSGTSIDFTGIPSWVKRITVMVNGVSTSGTSLKLIQLGAGSVLTTGYNSSTVTISSGGSVVSASTAGFIIASQLAAELISGVLILTNISANNWVGSGNFKFSTVNVGITSGDINVAGTLDRIRLTTVNGTDTFDAGTVNIMYE